MSYLLFPGRHLLNSAFQASYLSSILNMPLDRLGFLDSGPAGVSEPVDHIIFAVTSSNQQHSRYNPIPFYVRAIGVDRFARALERAYDFSYRIIGIPHYAPTPRFGEIILKEIAEQTEGNLRLTPDNCLVLCSTPAVFSLFRELGFAILPAEHGAEGNPLTPIELLKEFVNAGEFWATDPELRRQLAPATFDLWHDFPDIPRRILRLWRDPLLNDEGSLTEERDYASYAFGMSHSEILNVKYGDIKEAIVPGRIVDEGCADGALLVRIAPDFPDSDLIGIDITGEFLARCRERQRAGQFASSFVHFHQRNILEPIFEPGSIDTTICNSTIHELWSYGERAKSVHDYFALKFAQTRAGGRLVIRDVVGPPQKDQEIYLWLERADGANEDVFADFAADRSLKAHLDALSTYARFRRFARDFLPGRRAASARDAFPYREEMVDGDQYVVVRLRDAVEFMTKKDYTDNWYSEMHEEFAFWNFGQWKQGLSEAGFHVLENPNNREGGSRTYTSEWIVNHRWRNKVRLYRKEAGRLQPLPYPPTNLVLVAEKR